MKISKLWARAEEFLDSEKKKKREKRRCLKEVLKRLKAKEAELAKRIERESGAGKQKKLRKELDVVHAQRKKGIAALKELND